MPNSSDCFANFIVRLILGHQSSNDHDHSTAKTNLLEYPTNVVEVPTLMTNTMDSFESFSEENYHRQRKISSFQGEANDFLLLPKRCGRQRHRRQEEQEDHGIHSSPPRLNPSSISCIFQEKILPYNFTCGICHHVPLDDPVVTPCLHVFCRKCLFSTLDETSAFCCPRSGKRFETRHVRPLMGLSRRIWSNAHVQCFVCGWNGRMEEFEAHYIKTHDSDFKKKKSANVKPYEESFPSSLLSKYPLIPSSTPRRYGHVQGVKHEIARPIVLQSNEVTKVMKCISCHELPLEAWIDNSREPNVICRDCLVADNDRHDNIIGGRRKHDSRQKFKLLQGLELCLWEQIGVKCSNCSWKGPLVSYVNHLHSGLCCSSSSQAAIGFRPPPTAPTTVTAAAEVEEATAKAATTQVDHHHHSPIESMTRMNTKIPTSSITKDPRKKIHHPFPVNVAVDNQWETIFRQNEEYEKTSPRPSKKGSWLLSPSSSRSTSPTTSMCSQSIHSESSSIGTMKKELALHQHPPPPMTPRPMSPSAASTKARHRRVSSLSPLSTTDLSMGRKKNRHGLPPLSPKRNEEKTQNHHCGGGSHHRRQSLDPHYYTWNKNEITARRGMTERTLSEPLPLYNQNKNKNINRSNKNKKTTFDSDDMSHIYIPHL